MKEIKEKYQSTCKENCSLQSEILELKNGIEELKHKHELEIKQWKDNHNSLNNKYQAQAKTVLDLKEKVNQLTDTNVSEQHKHKNTVNDLNKELEQSEYQKVGTEKLKEDLEIENMRLSTANKKLNDEIEKWKEENRMLKKERRQLNKEIEDMQKPTKFDELLGKHIYQNLLIFV